MLQIIVYDIWSTIEESRIWDTALLESQRQVHFYSPQMSAMLGRIRTRIAQSFESVLAMSQRLQYELQRWHTQWVHAGESLAKERSTRHGLKLQTEQLQAKVLQLENSSRITSVPLVCMAFPCSRVSTAASHLETVLLCAAGAEFAWGRRRLVRADTSAAAS